MGYSFNPDSRTGLSSPPRRGSWFLLVLFILVAAQRVSGEERVYLAISLRQLEGVLREAAAGRAPLPDEAQRLFGLNRAAGYVVDSAHGDVILYGESDPEYPPLWLDDLAVALRTVWTTRGTRGCTIDPRPASLRRIQQFVAQNAHRMNFQGVASLSKEWRAIDDPQDVRVFGFPHRSRIAKVLVEADYLMKKLAAGALQVEGLTSCLDRLVETAEQQALSGAGARLTQISSRFWFYPDDSAPSYLVSSEIVHLTNGRVKLLTEEEHITRSGQMRGRGAPEPHAAAFAAEMTEKYAQVARTHQIYADMQNIFRLVSVLEAMRDKDAASTSGLSLDFWLRQYKPKPVEVPTTLPMFSHDKQVKISGRRGAYQIQALLWLPISGGVDMKFDLGQHQFSNLRGRLDLLARRILRRRPDATVWSLKSRLGFESLFRGTANQLYSYLSVVPEEAQLGSVSQAQ